MFLAVVLADALLLAAEPKSDLRAQLIRGRALLHFHSLLFLFASKAIMGLLACGLFLLP
jgi:hypothetical protein